MFKNYISVISVLYYVGIQLSHEACSSEGSILQTLNGKISGACKSTPVYYTNDITITDVLTWKKVPFAEPPINENRFKAPVPVKSWPGVLDGSVFSNACLQYDTDEQSSSEDCLYLNIFVKANSYLNKNVTLKPILVFIHGGALVSGSSSLYEPSTLVALGDIIVVTINYRLHALGFFHAAGTDATGNQGILDQTLALKWIYDNARSFGGDNSKITISGESAGGWSVGHQLHYQNSWPYYRNAIIQSGSPTGKENIAATLTSAESTRRARLFFSLVGCNTTNSNTQSIACVRALDSNSILNGYRSLDQYLIKSEGIKEANKNPIFLPTIDGLVFNKSINNLTNEGSFKQCNLITGYNKEEGSIDLLKDYLVLGADSSEYLNQAQNFNNASFNSYLRSIMKYFPSWNTVPSNDFYTNVYNQYISSNTNYLNTLARILSDHAFVCPNYKLAESFSVKNNKVYVYNYAYRFFTSLIPSNLVPYLGPATHADELIMTFGFVLSDDLALFTDDKEKFFNLEIVKYWTNFVKYNDPNGINTQTGVIWETFLNSSSKKLDSFVNDGKYISFTNDAIQMKKGYASHNCDFWYSNASRIGSKSIYISIMVGLFISFLY